MKPARNTRSTQQAVEAIHALDLGPIKFKLMDRDEGQGWTRPFVERMELEYKRFLTLMAKYPHEPLVPGKEVDRFWHAHILDTQKYVEDCERVFGHYLHHFPYFGMRGADDAAALAAAGERTRELYAAEFAVAAGEAASAFCSVAAQEAAFCSVAAQKAAFCSVALQEAAFCSVAVREPAFCSVAGRGIDTMSRPSLAPIA
jgi:hypothetical protein